MKKAANARPIKQNSILTKKVPLYYFVIFIFVGFIFVILFAGKIRTINIPEILGGKPSDFNNPEYKVKRLTGLKFIKPLLSAKPANEYEGYGEIKKSVFDLFRKYKDEGVIKNASMYLFSFDKLFWTSINENDKYIPGSILKIPVLITYLKMEQEHPGTLEKKFKYNTHFQSDLTQEVVSKGIEFGETYSVRQLLEYMIEYSDNNANLVLVQNIDWNLLCKLFTDLNMARPDAADPKYYMTVRECSRFMEILFNSTYLDDKYSEYAIDLLTKSNFTEGMVKGIPESNLAIAHKFGEAGTNLNYQLHETAILYIEDKPYLISIMTMANDNVAHSKLAEVIQDASGIIYEGLLNENKE